VGEAEESSSDASTIAIRCDQRCGNSVDNWVNRKLDALAQKEARVRRTENAKGLKRYIIRKLTGAEA
jgi:hypothetical protein